MKALQLHDWQMTADSAKRVQRELAAMVSKRNDVKSVRLVAGVDISAPDAAGFARAAVVVLSYPELVLTEKKVIVQKVTFPYIPGLLSFRESPSILAACEGLESTPDLILVDGQGLAHPRRLGLASHLGLLWDKPTIGCAKSRLCGEHEPVPDEQGAYTELVDQCETVGVVLRTKAGVAPLYISIGHKVDLKSAISWVLRCCLNQRLPEPTRLAHLAASGHAETARHAVPKAQLKLTI